MLFKEEDEQIEELKENDSTIKRDKIFENGYDSIIYDNSDIDFKISSSYDTGKEFIDSLEHEIFYETIVGEIENSRFKELNELNEDGSFVRLNKIQINEVYSYVKQKLPQFPKVHIFSIVQEYFDINPNKFYESLSNTFKKELIEELRSNGNLRGKTNRPLF